MDFLDPISDDEGRDLFAQYGLAVYESAASKKASSCSFPPTCSGTPIKLVQLR